MAYQKQQPNMLLIWHTRHENAKEVSDMDASSIHPWPNRVHILICDDMNDMYG